MKVYLILTATMGFTPRFRVGTFVALTVLTFLGPDWTLFGTDFLLGVLLADLSIILEEKGSSDQSTRKPPIFQRLWPFCTVILALLLGSYTEHGLDRMAWPRYMDQFSRAIFPRSNTSTLSILNDRCSLSRLRYNLGSPSHPLNHVPANPSISSLSQTTPFSGKCFLPRLSSSPSLPSLDPRLLFLGRWTSRDNRENSGRKWHDRGNRSSSPVHVDMYQISVVDLVDVFRSIGCQGLERSSGCAMCRACTAGRRIRQWHEEDLIRQERKVSGTGRYSSMKSGRRTV
jgi:hypothetical protein